MALIRLFGISVYLEGNVIDLGTYKLQVVDACSGLRYLFPLVERELSRSPTFSRRPSGSGCVVFLASIPLTILMNSIRIGITGILVNYWGNEMAEGFIHDFEGWIFFMVCTALLLGLVWLLTRLGPPQACVPRLPLPLSCPRRPPKGPSSARGRCRSRSMRLPLSPFCLPRPRAPVLKAGRTLSFRARRSTSSPRSSAPGRAGVRSSKTFISSR